MIREVLYPDIPNSGSPNSDVEDLIDEGIRDHPVEHHFDASSLLKRRTARQH